MARELRALHTPLTLAVLTLLAERPRHPYEMKIAIRERHVDDVVKMRGGSLYDAIGRLERAELVRQLGTARAGSRPERTVYEITESGRALLYELLAEMLTEPVNEYPRFVAALAHLPALGPEAAARLLRLRAQRLREDYADTARMVAEHSSGVPRAVLLEAEFLQHQRAAEIDWLDGVARDIDHGMSWPDVDPSSDGEKE
ncbi:PadR family transcriptional regulator [Nocardia cyriacigeorgica]|uniref:PadR family transcriptional regulator n=1 Tax=Nocardia cyriacigeorgica TaxID=135487 RepID=UPI002811C1A1|nr:PadR family transcriptional regulator [Nocardia cyriacigeorgica]